MTDSGTANAEFPDASMSDDELGSLIRQLMDRFVVRDQRLKFREALVFRRSTMEHKTGQYIPPPFDGSRTLVKHASGLLVDRAHHMAAKVAENPVNYRVNVITSTSGNATAEKLTAAGNQQDALDAFEWQANINTVDPMQEICAFYAVTLGVGWYHSYEDAMGWNTPSRIYYDDKTEDELDALRISGDVVKVMDGDGQFRYAENADIWQRRKEDAQRENAVTGESLFIDEVIHPGSVYYRKDTRGISMAAIVEEVPAWDTAHEYGLALDSAGNIIVGADLGGPAGQQRIADKTWTRIRVWTRDEVYYYVSRHQGGVPNGVGRIVWHSKHDYAEVPLWPAIAAATGASDPAEEYIPLLEGAYAMMPGYNQVITLLSNAAIFNATPRFIIITNDGTPVMDPNTKEPLVVETDNVAGLDPRFAAVIQGGGTFQQLKVENVGDIVKLLEVYAAQLDQTLPPEAATGASSQYEPAWGTRLKQAAANVKISPVIKNHAKAKTFVGRFKSRVIKLRGQKVTVFGVPSKRTNRIQGRKEIVLDPKDISMNISVHQDDADAQERIVRTQVGMELLNARRISPIKFYDEFMGEDDPLGAMIEAKAWELAEVIFIEEMVPRIRMRVAGRIAQRTPNEMQAEAATAGAQAQQQRPDVQPGNPAAAAGIRGPGMGQGLTPNTPPPLQGQGAPPLQGGMPV